MKTTLKIRICLTIVIVGCWLEKVIYKRDMRGPDIYYFALISVVIVADVIVDIYRFRKGAP